MQKWWLAGFITLFVAQTTPAADPAAPVWTSETLKQFKAPDAKQGVAVDDQCFYTISNREIGKYKKETGEEVARWKDEEGGPFTHLNAAIAVDGRLYGAHSNFPGIPMKSSVEIWDTATMKLVDRHDFGETDGSLTWLANREGTWFAAFVHYAGRGGVAGRGPKFSRVVKLDQKWQPVQEWTFPPELIERFAGNSASCGAFGPGGYLWVTGHSAKEFYVLDFPKEGSVLRWIATVPVAIEGQAYAWDPANPDVAYGISRKLEEIIVVRVKKQ